MPKVSSTSFDSFWRRASTHSWRDVFLAVEALAWLAAARFAIRLLPFRVIVRGLGMRDGETTTQDDPASRLTLLRAGWAIRAASRRAPWRCKCLEQGVAAKRMLHARGIPATLYLGVARSDGVRTHAWLRSGSILITGGDVAGGFTVVSRFGGIE